MLLAHTIKVGNGGTTTTNAIDTTGADLLVAVFGLSGSHGTITLTDSKGNTWEPLDTQTTEGGTKIYFCRNPASVGSGHTVSGNTSANSFVPLAFLAYSGFAGGFDVQNGTTNSGTTIQPGSTGTPTEPNSLFITSHGFNQVQTASPSINSSFSVSDYQNHTPGASYGLAVAYKIQSGQSAENPTWTNDTSASNSAAIAVFKPTPPITLTADKADFALSGQAANVSATRKLTADKADFALSGQNASLGVAVNYNLEAETRFISLNGKSAYLDYSAELDVITFCHRRPLEIQPVISISTFENLDGTEDVVEDLPVKRVFNMNSIYLGETERLEVYNFLIAHRLRQPFIWLNPDRNDEVLVVKLIRFTAENQNLNSGNFEFTLKEV